MGGFITTNDRPFSKFLSKISVTLSEVEVCLFSLLCLSADREVYIYPGEAIKIHLQEPGELVTHEDWRVDDQLTFCGGYGKEESHVKLVSIHDQKTRIIGAGAWWEGGTPFELSQYNWWHASGARDGKWVATDNWHGHIAVIDM